MDSNLTSTDPDEPSPKSSTKQLLLGAGNTPPELVEAFSNTKTKNRTRRHLEIRQSLMEDRAAIQALVVPSCGSGSFSELLCALE